MNRVNIILTLTRDPEIRYTPAGTAVCSFSGAYNETYGKGEDKKTVVSYFDCIAWSGLAELVNTHFKKGHKIQIQVQSTAYPLFAVNPQKFVENPYKAEKTDYTKASQKIFNNSVIEVEVLK